MEFLIGKRTFLRVEIVNKYRIILKLFYVNGAIKIVMQVMKTTSNEFETRPRHLFWNLGMKQIYILSLNRWTVGQNNGYDL